MNRSILTGLVIGLLAGFIIGYFTGTSHESSHAAAPIAAAIPAPGNQAEQGTPATAPNPMATPVVPPNAFQAQQRIFTNQQVVAREPKNLQAWVALGNDYFDTHQHQKAVEAYGKALEIDPKNPDIITDQGIMYRELLEFDKAIANFERASKIDPKHLQSLFNLGIVYAHDKKHPEKALKAWNRVVEISPASPQADQARVGIESLKAKPSIN